MESKAALEKNLCHAAARLAGKGLMKVGDMLSQRIPERGAFAQVELRTQQDVPEAVRWTSLSGPLVDMHHRLYHARADVGAILLGRQDWGAALAGMDRSMPGVFDEQIRHLGLEVRRISTPPEGDRLLAALSSGANAFVLDKHILCFGMTLDRVMLNAELLEKCAKAYILATTTGLRIRRIPWLIRYVANSRLRRDEKLAAASHNRGERAIPKTGY